MARAGRARPVFSLRGGFREGRGGERWGVGECGELMDGWIGQGSDVRRRRRRRRRSTRTYRTVPELFARGDEGREGQDALGGLELGVRPNVPAQPDALPGLELAEVRHGCCLGGWVGGGRLRCVVWFGEVEARFESKLWVCERVNIYRV